MERLFKNITIFNDEIIEKEVFVKVGLLGRKPFNGNIYKLINNAYPGRFEPEDFDRNRGIVQLGG
ncbi:hypothetical protein GOV12_05540 [Candidatus Pacearchaeota archaeon]|nr:hypothetical protein [Candidatus Pacearchaeota archaeon]